MNVHTVYMILVNHVLILLSSCIRIIYDNYNTIELNEAFINNFFAIILQLLYLIFVQLADYYLLLFTITN
jgi:hypothetical protein